LQKLRDSQCFPALQAVFPDRLEAFVEGNSLCASTRAQIQRMKGIDLETIFEIPARPIQCMQAASQHLQGFWKIHLFCWSGSGDQASLAQYAFDRRERWERCVSIYFAQLAPDRSCADQADFLLHQASPRLNNELPHPRRITAWHGRRSS
jgi:hypothetical protein